MANTQTTKETLVALIEHIGDNLDSLMIDDFESMDSEARGYDEGITFGEFIANGLTVYTPLGRDTVTLTIYEDGYDISLNDAEDEDSLYIKSIDDIPEIGLEAVFKELVNISKNIKGLE